MSKYDEYVIVVEASWSGDLFDNCPYFTCSLPLLNALRISGMIESQEEKRHPNPGTTYGLTKLEKLIPAIEWAIANLPNLEIRTSAHGMELWNDRHGLSHEEFFNTAIIKSELFTNWEWYK